MVLTVNLVDLSGVIGLVEVAMGSSPHWWGVSLARSFGDSWSGLLIAVVLSFDPWCVVAERLYSCH